MQVSDVVLHSFSYFLSIPQVLSYREALSVSLHSRPRLEVEVPLEEVITAIAAMHNIIKAGGGEVIPT
jgi:hypothetical protein